MTKRVLSLLLTLVMVLSLCVPAIAADGEFVAEAPADVVEEAPAAPVEPEAPEAEEPAEEPVVDEPMAEEADAPEMASLMEEEDVPLLVALGVVSHEAHLQLEEAVENAEPYKARVDAGELYGKNDPDALINKTGDNTRDGDVATKFNKAYEKAVLFLNEGLNSQEVGEDVSSTSVKAVAKALTDLIPSTLDDDWTKELNQNDGLTNVPNSDMTLGTWAKLYTTQYKNAAGKDVYNTYLNGTSGKAYNTTFSVSLNTAIEADDLDELPWTQMYRSDYLTALKAAAEAAETYVKKSAAGTAKYEDYSAVAELLKAAEALEPAAALPNQSECDQLAALLKEFDDVVKNNKQNDYVDGATSFSNYKNTNTAGDYTKAKQLFDQLYTGLNGFKIGITYYDYNRALTDLQVILTKKAASADFVKQKITNMSSVDVYVGFPMISKDGTTSTALTNDGSYYGYSIQIDGKYKKADGTKSDDPVIFALDGSNTVNPRPWTTTTNATTFTAGGTTVPDYMINTITVAPFTGGVFTPDSVVVLTLYKAYSYVDGTDTKYDWSEYESKTYTIKFPADGYYGPIIGTKATDITVNYGDTGTGIVYNGLDKAQVFGTRSAGNEITITVKTEGNNLNATRAKWTGHNNGNEFKMALVDAEGEDIFAANRNPAATHGGWNTPGSGNDTAVLNFKENPDAEYDVLAGDMQLEFSITWGNNDLVVHDGGAATVTFESITEWAGMEAIQDLLDDVADLVQSDYELRTATAQSPIHGTVTTVEAAWSVINNDVAALQGYLNGGSYANTKANRQNVINLAQDLVQVYQYLKVKAVTREDLQKAVDQAAEFKPAEDYTYESWKALSKALKKANKALASGLESDIAEAASALNAAIAGMRKEGEVDKAALKSAIAAAQALVEADYTAESWAANKAAIDDAVKAAQAVVDNAKATQSQVNTALNVLNGAMDKLVKKAPEGPKAPASGNGWVYDYATGDDYYFVNGKMVTNYWAGQSNGGSKWNLWYYLGSDGKLVKGFNYIVDDNGTGWYMLETGNGDTRGQMLTGWQKTGTAAGTGWFNTGRGADHGKCTYTSGWGDYSASTGMWADGLSHR